MTKLATGQNINRITDFVARDFRCFGGGRVCIGNPISEVLKDRSPMFAAGVDVRAVVEAVLRHAERPTNPPKKGKKGK